MEVSITILALNASKEIILHLGCPGVPVVWIWYSGWVATGGGSNKHSISSTHTWYTMYVRICIWYNWFHHYFKRMNIFCITPANFRWHCQSQRCRQPGRRCWRLTLTGRIPRSEWECRQSLLPAVCLSVLDFVGHIWAKICACFLHWYTQQPMTIFRQNPLLLFFIDGILILPGTDIACWCWPWSSCRRPPPWKPPQGCAASPRRRRWCIPTLSDLSCSCSSKGICFQSSRSEILGSPSSVSSALDPYISIWKMNCAKKSCWTELKNILLDGHVVLDRVPCCP